MDFLALWKHLALLWISILLSNSNTEASDSTLPLLDEKKLMQESLSDAKKLANSTIGYLPVNMTTTIPPLQNATNGNSTSYATLPESDDTRSTVATVLTSTIKSTTKLTTAATLISSFNESLPITTQPDTFHSSTLVGHKVEFTTHFSTTNDTIVTDALNTDASGSGTDAHPLSPAILAVIAVVATILFFVILYAIFKLVQSFTAVRFRRLHEMPMDDFDDFSGVYAEHTVPFRA